MAGFDDAAVSIALPKIPDGGFSPVRLQGRNFRRGLPSALVCHRPSCPRLPPLYPCTVSGTVRLQAPPCERIDRSTPGALAPARVMLSRAIVTYLAPSAPLAGTSRLRRVAAYTRCHRCAPIPRRLGNPRVDPCFRCLFSIGMSSPETPGSSSAACTQFLHR